MILINDVVNTVFEASYKMLRRIKNNKLLLLIGYPYVIIMSFGIQLSQNLGFLSMLALLAVISFGLSSYMYIIGKILILGSVDIEDLKKSVKIYPKKIAIVTVLIWLIFKGIDTLLFPLFQLNVLFIVLSLIIKLIFLLIINPVFEVIYIKNEEGINNMKRALSFNKENIWQWNVPIIIAVVLLYFVLQVKSNIVIFIVLGTLINPVVIFRFYLFKALDSTTMRRRIFKRHNH